MDTPNPKATTDLCVSSSSSGKCGKGTIMEFGRHVFGAGLLTAALALNGCGAANENSSTETTSGTTVGRGTSTSHSGSSSASGSGSGSSGSPDNGLAWVPFGPDDPKFPTPGWDVYYYFLEHNCQSLQNDVQTPDAGFGNLYRAAVAVCRAAVDGEQDQWSVASAAFADRGAGAPSARRAAWTRRYPPWSRPCWHGTTNIRAGNLP